MSRRSLDLTIAMNDESTPQRLRALSSASVSVSVSESSRTPMGQKTPKTPRSSRNMILKNSVDSPTSSPRKVRVVKMDSPRTCSSAHCGGSAFKLIEEHGKTGVSNYYCEECIEKLCAPPSVNNANNE